MSRLWAWWIALLDRRETGECLAAMRILAGLTILAIVGELVGHELVAPLYYAPEHGGYLAGPSRSWLVDALGGATPEVVWGLLLSAALAGVALVLGLGGRVAALVASQCLLALRGINAYQGSYGALLSNGLWLCVLARCDATWSLRCRLRTGSWTSAEAVPAWPRMLGVLQLVILYLWTGLSKVSAAWIGDFSALYYILQDPAWRRFDGAWVASVYPLSQLFTGLVWVWEFSFPIILLGAYYRETADRPGRLRAWFNRYDLRIPYAIFGVGTHLTISVLMVVGPFVLATLIFYPCLFSPGRWRELLARLLARLTPGARSA